MIENVVENQKPGLALPYFASNDSVMTTPSKNLKIFRPANKIFKATTEVSEQVSNTT